MQASKCVRLCGCPYLRVLGHSLALWGWGSLWQVPLQPDGIMAPHHHPLVQASVWLFLT